MTTELQFRLLLPNDPLLLNVSLPIPLAAISSNQIQSIVDELLHLAYGGQVNKTKPVLVGLAAPQVGIAKRIILVDIGADGHGGTADVQVFINPEITKVSARETSWYEGCFSTDRVCGIVSRPHKITLKAYTRTAEKIEKIFEGYTARIIQHEIDHLNGKEFVSHIRDDADLHWVEEDEFPEYRDNEAWRNWPNKCSREKWEKIKGIGTS